MSSVEARLKDLGIVLPSPAAPVANYVPFLRAGNLLFISGQLPLGIDGKIAARHIGKLGREVFNEAGQEAARLAAVNVLAQAKIAVAGQLDAIRRCVRLGGFINCMPDFAALPAVMNGASDLLVEVFDEKGRHARTTVGVAELPFDSAVEVEAIFEVN
jgi:enamine deaminase RidA (YjgF/YER057c/UK114 family)